MSTSKLVHGGLKRNDGCDAPDDTRALFSALRELLERIVTTTADDPEAATGEVETWDGEDYLYLEVALPDSAEFEADVNIQCGRAFIRLAR